MVYGRSLRKIGVSVVSVSPDPVVAFQLALMAALSRRFVYKGDGFEQNQENKIFFAWLKITELRNIVAAKRILIRRRKHKLKVIKLLNPQVNLLNRWELLARRHLEAVASLIKVLEGTCLYIPLVDGAKANLVMVHTSIFGSLDMMLAIEAAIKTFYSKAELLKSLLCELVKIIQEEIEGLDELRNTNNLISSLEMHEISLRGSLIQAKKKETASSPNEIKTGLSWRQFHLHYRII
ncbi:QWRF motif-containing protein 7-like [Phalaenopsis equestris]|uniref:QWRF motif-containing protein 7-like n=1 Tax=Phalaenopsis equestris TaxID=78828 RepID=UPI0009E2EF0B|nr:QWRF motif-containing protein 7-like [Phalaenopsis equestris]